MPRDWEQEKAAVGPNACSLDPLMDAETTRFLFALARSPQSIEAQPPEPFVTVCRSLAIDEAKSLRPLRPIEAVLDALRFSHFGSKRWHVAVGRYYAAIFRLNEALDHLDRAARLPPPYEGECLYAAYVLSAMGETEDARLVARQHAEQAQSMAALLDCARVLTDVGAHDLVLAEYGPRLLELTNEFDAQQLLGECYAASNDEQSADSYFKHAAALAAAQDLPLQHFWSEEKSARLWKSCRDRMTHRLRGPAPRLAFCHIFKCAGSATHASFQSSLGPVRTVDLYGYPHHYEPLWQGLTTGEANWLTHATYVYQHLAMPLRPPAFTGFDLTTILRHPADRFFSAFKFERNRLQPGDADTRLYDDFEKYMRVMVEERVNCEVMSRHLMAFADQGMPDLLDPAAIHGTMPVFADRSRAAEEVARASLRFPFVGIQEHLPATMFCLAAALGLRWLPVLRRVNVSTPLRGETITRSARAYIERTNPLDYELYVTCRDRFESDFADVAAYHES